MSSSISQATRLGWGVGFLLLLAAGGRAQTPPPTAASSTSPAGPARLRPGEYPQHPFRSPFPDPVSSQSEEFRENYLFGDWFGARSWLAERGIRPNLFFITDPFGNPGGGRHRGFSFFNLLGLDLFVDSEPLFGWRGGTFHVGFANSSGTDLSTERVGNAFPIQLAAAGAPATSRLTYLSYTQSFLDEALSVRLGRLTINSVYGEEFLGSEYFKAFGSVAFDLVPLGPFLNAPGAFGYPFTTWGGRVKFEPQDAFYVMAGVYNGDPDVREPGRHGVDFSLDGPPFAIGEVALRWNYGTASAGPQGNLKLGGYRNGGHFDKLDSPPGQPAGTVNGASGVYVLGDQVVQRWGPAEENRHLGIFGAFDYAPNQSISPVPYYFIAGLVGYGVLPNRPKDFVGFGVAFGSYSSALSRTPADGTGSSSGGKDFEMTLEWNYGWTVMPGVFLQPDIQYIVHPGGDASISNALAIGTNIVLHF